MDKSVSEKLIEYVKQYPELYDPKHRLYKNAARKQHVWENIIAKEMNEPCEMLRTKWKGLKDGYMKHKKWILYRHATTKTFENWCWAPYLDFLDPHIIPRKVCRVGIQDSSHMEISESRDETEYTLEMEDDNTKDDERAVKFEIRSRSSSPRDPIEPSGPHNNEEIINFVEAKRLKGIDSVDLLFMSYADSFKKFSVGTQAKMKIKLASMFAVAELEEHNMDPNTILN